MSRIVYWLNWKGIRSPVEKHQVAYDTGQEKRRFSYVEHCLISGHRFHVWSAELLLVGSRFYRRKSLEDYEIMRHRQQYAFCVLNKVLPESGFVHHLFSSNDLLPYQLVCSTCWSSADPLISFPYLFACCSHWRCPFAVKALCGSFLLLFLWIRVNIFVVSTYKPI